MADNLEREKLEKSAAETTKEENSSEELGIATMVLKELSVQNKRLDEANKRQQKTIYALLIMISLIVGGFVWFLSQYDFSYYEVNSQDGGNANYIGNDGDIYNGEGAGNQFD